MKAASPSDALSQLSEMKSGTGDTFFCHWWPKGLPGLSSHAAMIQPLPKVSLRIVSYSQPSSSKPPATFLRLHPRCMSAFPRGPQGLVVCESFYCQEENNGHCSVPRSVSLAHTGLHTHRDMGTEQIPAHTGIHESLYKYLTETHTDTQT